MSMEYYRGMLVQRTRVEAFRRALSETVKPGDHVLEIGTGLGTYAFFAADAGAARVWAVEGAPVINVAKAIARLNGYADRVEFIRGWFPGVALPERVDVLIYEDYPSRLIDSWTHDVLTRLHRDALKPGARIVPDRARLLIAPVHAARTWSVVGGFAGDDDTAYDIDWSPSREYICNTPLHMPIERDDLLHDPCVAAEVRLNRVPSFSDLVGEATWQFDRDCALHGFAYWFELQVGSVWLSNAPGGDPGSWGYLYLPVPEPLVVSRGDTVTCRVGPDGTAHGAPGWLSWDVRCGKTRFRGHEFKSFPASLADVIPTSPSWVPELDEAARLELRVLSLVDGTRSVDQIAAEIRGTGTARSLDEVRNLVRGTLTGRTKPTSRAAKG